MTCEDQIFISTFLYFLFFIIGILLGGWNQKQHDPWDDI